MPGIEELVEGDPRPHRNQFNSVEAARVASESGGEVSLQVLSFSREQSYASVPYIATGAGTPSNGDSAVLHSDSEGRPIYAVVFNG